MGNCIGKKSLINHKQHHGLLSINSPMKRKKLDDQLCLKQTSMSYIVSSSSHMNTSSERNFIFESSSSNIKETNITLNDDDQSERKIIQYSSPTFVTTISASPTNDPFVFIPSASSEYMKLKSNDTVSTYDENIIKQSFALTKGEKDMMMGPLFRNENDRNKKNDHNDDNEMASIDIKVQIADKIQNENHQFITIIDNHQLSNCETMINTQDFVQGSFNKSPSPSIFDSSFSSLSYNTTPFSSQDRLVLSSSPSSSSSAIQSPVSLTPLNTIQLSSASSSDSTKTNPNFNQNGSRSLAYSEQIYLNKQISSLNDEFKVLLPESLSRSNNNKNNSFINEFHQNIQSHSCKILSSIIDNVLQQQFLRIHQSSKVTLIEHRDLECQNLKEVKKFDTPTLIYDNQQKIIYITKHGRLLGLQSFTCTTNNVVRLPKLLTSCDHCSTLISGLKLNNRLHPFLLVNITHNLIETCFNQTDYSTKFGYISNKNRNKIQQTIVNNEKFAYSYDLDIQQTTFYFVIRVNSWPNEIRSTYERRQRLWPNDIKNLFENTCFIRINNETENKITKIKCFSCEHTLSSSFDSTWSYTYASIESKLVSMMSDEQLRFASVLWNYLNGKTQGQLPFHIFKHTLFYFFEQYSSDYFNSSDLMSHTNIFTDYLFNCLQTKTIRHYFNSNSNLYNDNLSITLMSTISIKMTYLDLKNFSVYCLPKTSLHLYKFIYLMEFEKCFLQNILSCTSSKTNSIQTILDTHEFVIKQLSLGVKTYKKQLEKIVNIETQKPLTLDCLYEYQEENVQIILDYLPLLREKEPSLVIHSLWSMFIQYFNCLFNDLFTS